MDKFILKKTSAKGGFYPVNVRKETYEKITLIKNKTDMKIVDIVDAMVDFCIERLIVEEED